MEHLPLVSVLLPTLDRGAYVADAVHSVLNQDYTGELELIVIDNGSSDDTREVLQAIEDPRMQVIGEPRRGIASALNRGLSLARGELVARNDSDDLWLPHLLQTLTPALVGNGETVAAYGRARGIPSTGEPLPELRGHPPRDPHDPLGSLLLGDYTSSIATIARRDAVLALGGWSEDAYACEDWELAIGLAARGTLRFIDVEVAHFRRHPGNITSLSGDSAMTRRLESRRKILDRAFARLPTDSPARTRRAAAYRNLHIGEGHQWLQSGQPGRALQAYRRSLAQGRPLEGLARIAWTGAMWFGPETFVSLGDRLLRMRRRARF